jgi:hypothetical protein
MTPIERELHRAAVKNRKIRLSGIHNEVCLGCGCDLAQGKEDDHMAGCKHSDVVWPLCAPKSCHHRRSESVAKRVRTATYSVSRAAYHSGSNENS